MPIGKIKSNRLRHVVIILAAPLLVIANMLYVGAIGAWDGAKEACGSLRNIWQGRRR